MAISNVTMYSTYQEMVTTLNQALTLLNGRLVFFTSNNAALTLTSNVAAGGNVFVIVITSVDQSDTSTINLAPIGVVRSVSVNAKAAFDYANGVYTNTAAAFAKANLAAFAAAPDARRQRLHERFLQIYAGRLAEATVLFPGMAAVLDRLEAEDIPWGVVTNKPARLTEPLLAQLGLRTRCACAVSGDTTPARKPHPRPLLHALALIAAHAADAVYVGDAERDIAAGRAAGMRTVAATYGYTPPGQTRQAGAPITASRVSSFAFNTDPQRLARYRAACPRLSRQASFTCSTPPKLRRAAYRASSGLMPRICR